MRHFVVVLLAVPFLAGMLAMPAYPGNPSPGTTTQRTVSPTDSQIEATIRTKLAKSKIGKDGFRFHVQRGIVTWEGTTSVVQHKGSATRMAKAAGAVQVINKIQITGNGKVGIPRKAYVQQ